MFCKKCGQEINKDSAFCPHCGAAAEAMPKKKKKPIFKRWWFWVIVIVFLFVACVGSGGSENENSPSSNSSNVQTVKQNTDETEVSEAAETVISETVIYNEGGITITATGLDNNTFWGKEIKFLVDNQTDRNIIFTGDDFIVNGIMLDGSLYIDVAAGMKANGGIEFFSQDLRNAGIEDIVSVEAKECGIKDGDSYDEIAKVEFALKSNSEYIQEVNTDGKLVYESNGVSVIAQFTQDGVLSDTLLMLIKNESESDILVSDDNVSVNGFTITSFMYDVVYAGTVRYCELDMLNSSLEENGIEEIEQMTFTLEFRNPHTYELIAASDQITVDFE